MDGVGYADQFAQYQGIYDQQNTYRNSIAPPAAAHAANLSNSVLDMYPTKSVSPRNYRSQKVQIDYD